MKHIYDMYVICINKYALQKVYCSKLEDNRIDQTLLFVTVLEFCQSMNKGLKLLRQEEKLCGVWLTN